MPQKPDSFETISCPGCGGETHHLWGIARDFLLGGEERWPYVECDSCGLVYLNPRPRDMGPYYPEGDYWAGKGHSLERWKPHASRLLELALSEGDWVYQEVWQALEQLAPEKGRSLDVGAGLGVFQACCRHRGWEARGIEPVAGPAAFGREIFGLEVEKTFLLDANLPENGFDFVSFTGVLEHVPNPRENLLETWRILKPGGLALIVVPNLRSLSSRLFGEYWYAFDAPRHLIQFTPTTLANILRDVGLPPVYSLHCSLAHDSYSAKESFRYWYRTHLDRLRERPPFQVVKPYTNGELPTGRDEPPLTDTEVNNLFQPVESPLQGFLWKAARPFSKLAGILGKGDTVSIFARKPTNG